MNCEVHVLSVHLCTNNVAVPATRINTPVLHTHPITDSPAFAADFGTLTRASQSVEHQFKMAPFRAESVLIVTYDKVIVEGETTVCDVPALVQHVCITAVHVSIDRY